MIILLELWLKNNILPASPAIFPLFFSPFSSLFSLFLPPLFQPHLGTRDFRPAEDPSCSERSNEVGIDLIGQSSRPQNNHEPYDQKRGRNARESVTTQEVIVIKKKNARRRLNFGNLDSEMTHQS